MSRIWLLPSDELDSTRVMPGTALTRLFHRSRDQFLDLERTHTWVAGSHVELWLLELRHEIDRKPGERDHTEQRDHRADHEHRDRALNRETRDTHISTLS